MNYFKVFSLIWGVIMIGVRLLMHVMPEKWNDFELKKAYPENRPNWIWAVVAVSVIVIIVTWYMEFTTAIPLSIILTVLVTATLIKAYQVLFNYTRFRDFVIKALIEERRLIVKINMATTILGIVLILLGIFVY